MNLHDMITFLPPTKNQKKNDASKKGSIKYRNSPGCGARKDAPTTWHHHHHPPPTWFQELFLQAPMWQVSRNRLPWIAAMKILKLGWRVKFFWGEGKARNDVFCSPQNNEVKGCIYYMSCLYISARWFQPTHLKTIN